MAKYLKYSKYFNAALITGVLGEHFYSRTLGLQEMKDDLELKIDGKPITIPPKLNSLINDVMDDMRLSTAEKSLIKPFLTGSLDLKHFGFLGGQHGVILGIPHFFLLGNKVDFNFGLVVDDYDFPPESPPAQVLKATVCLSDEAKKFGVAREIYESGHFSFYTNGVVPLFLIYLVTLLTAVAQKNPKNKLNRLGHFLYFQLFLMGLCIFILIHDFTAILRECDADLKAAYLGKSYVEGGIEFYEKMLERNKQVKKYCKEAPFDEQGDVNVDYIRTNHMPLMKRIGYLKQILALGDEGEKLSARDFVSIMSQSKLFNKLTEN